MCESGHSAVTAWVLKDEKTKGACPGLVHFSFVYNLEDSLQLTILVPSLDTASHAGQVSRSVPCSANREEASSCAEGHRHRDLQPDNTLSLRNGISPSNPSPRGLRNSAEGRKSVRARGNQLCTKESWSSRYNRCR